MSPWRHPDVVKDARFLMMYTSGEELAGSDKVTLQNTQTLEYRMHNIFDVNHQSHGATIREVPFRAVHYGSLW